MRKLFYLFQVSVTTIAFGLLLWLLFTLAPYELPPPPEPPTPPKFLTYQTGVASWYGRRYHGRKTTYGETYDMNELTTAHRDLPYNTIIRVRNLGNGCEELLRVTDTGPFPGIVGKDYFTERRVLDVSRQGAKELCFFREGKALVEIAVATGF